MSFANKIFVITGANSGMGFDTAVDSIGLDEAHRNAEADLRKLADEILKYRKTLTAEERQEFDGKNFCFVLLDNLFNFDVFTFNAEIWGLDANGCFASNESNRKNVGSVAERVLMDLQNVHLSLSAEETRLEDENETNKERGKRLLFLFQCDLLPGLSGKILESKGQRDRIAAPQVGLVGVVVDVVFRVAVRFGKVDQRVVRAGEGVVVGGADEVFEVVDDVVVGPNAGKERKVVGPGAGERPPPAPWPEGPGRFLPAPAGPGPGPGRRFRPAREEHRAAGGWREQPVDREEYCAPGPVGARPAGRNIRSCWTWRRGASGWPGSTCWMMRRRR